MHKLDPIAPALLAWYRENRRILPFREDPTPYHIWVSEIMLQQTRVAAVLPYYERLMRNLPDIPALAACPPEKLHKLWEGLGYYSRVRNLQKAAQEVVARYGGELPGDFEALRALPGIGDYTAGAIASIAFGLPNVAVDGNVLRVFSRLLAFSEDVGLPVTKKQLSAEVQRQQPPEAPGDYNQALMELGALVCLPKTLLCNACPLQALCAGYKEGVAASLPVKAPKKAKQHSAVCVFVCHNEAGQVLLQQRPPQGLLANLWQPFALESPADSKAALHTFAQFLPNAVIGQALPPAKHIFTHRVWNLQGWACHVPQNAPLPAHCVWATPAQLQNEYAVPGAFKAYLTIMLKANEIVQI